MQIPTSQGSPQASQMAVETALPVTGNISRTDGQTVLSSMDTLFGGMLEDRSARFVGGGSISLDGTGTTLTFSDRLDFVYNNAGTKETITSVVAASGTLTFTANGNMSYVVLTKGSPGSVTLTSNATSLPAATTSQEVFLLAIRRDDLSPATERVYLYNQLSLTAGQTLAPGVPSLGTATPTVNGSVTSYFPIVQSAIKSLSSAGYTITTTDGYEAIVISTGASNQTVNLPAASANTGRIIQFKKTDSGAGKIIISRAGSDTIDGFTTYSLSVEYDSITLVCDGTTWNTVQAPIVVPGTIPGLVSASGVPGNTTGSAIASGYVGEFITSSSTSITLTTSAANTVGLALTAGVWLIWGTVQYNSSATSNTRVFANLTTSQNASDGQLGYTKTIAAIGNNGTVYEGIAVIMPHVVSVSSSTNYYLSGNVDANNQSSAQSAASVGGVRIA